MWKYDNQEFETNDEVMEYAREHLFTFDDTDIEKYVRDEYGVISLWCLMNDAIRAEPKGHMNNTDAIASALIETVEGIVCEAEEKCWRDATNGVKPTEGESWDFDGNVFEWVDDPEEEA